MRIFLFTLFVSFFIGLSLYTAIWYTQTHIQPNNPLKSSVAVGHLDNLFAEKVRETHQEELIDQDWDYEEAEEETSLGSIEEKQNLNRGTTERKGPAVEKKVKGTPRGKTDTKTHDFGSIDEGDVITHYFTVSNKGTAPLRITDFEVGCGCTMVDYPKQAIQPGKDVKIKAVFDSKNKLGPQNKLLRLVTNGVPKNLDMYFKGYVYPQNFGKTTEEEKTPADTTKNQLVNG